MKKIQVNHMPDFMHGFATTVALLWGVVVILLSALLHSHLSKPISIAVLLLMLVVAVYIDKRKTIIEYDTDKIRWKWLFLAYTVNFNEMQSVHYTITSKRTRGGYIRRFEIVFNVNDKELRLNDIINTKDIENCINITPDDIQLMQLYKFIESNCPEKSQGFIKTDNTY